VKPEDQGTFLQDFLGVSDYFCSVPEMLRITIKPNGSRWWQVGGTRLAVETEKTQSLENAARTQLSAASMVGQPFASQNDGCWK
jgi:hypothetical protein